MNINPSFNKIEFSLNTELPQFIRGKTEKALNSLFSHYYASSDFSENSNTKHIDVIVTNLSLQEVSQWRVRTNIKKNNSEYPISIHTLSSISDKSSTHHNCVKSLIAHITSHLSGLSDHDFPNIILMCCHNKRIEDCIYLIRATRVHNIKFNFMFDEPDANKGVIKDFLKTIRDPKCLYDIGSIQYITATPFEDFWKMLKSVGITELMNKDKDSINPYGVLLTQYRQITDHKHRFIEDTFKNPVQYCQHVYQNHIISKHKWREKRKIIFAPAAISVKSHLEMADFFNDQDFTVVIHNGQFKGFRDAKKIHTSFKDYRKKYNLGEDKELRDVLRHFANRNKKIDIAITGYWTIERGITFNKNKFNFTHMIISDSHMKQLNKLIQLLGRGNGNKTYCKQIRLMCSETLFNTADEVIKNIIELKKIDPDTFVKNDFKTKIKPKGKNPAIPVKITLTEEKHTELCNICEKQKSSKRKVSVHKFLEEYIRDFKDMRFEDKNTVNNFDITKRKLKAIRYYKSSHTGSGNRFDKHEEHSKTGEGKGAQTGDEETYAIDFAKVNWIKDDYTHNKLILWITYRY